MPDTFQNLLMISLLFASISCNFTVFSPMNLREELQKIPYVIGNYGDIPYSKKLTGRLILSLPLDCCKPFNTSTLNPSNEKNKTMKFLLISRGNCTFVQKSQQAQLMGAKMAVIYDNTDEFNEKMIMTEDGHGDEINIPTILIPKSIGQKLSEHLTQGEIIDMMISFSTFKQPIVNYQFWLNIRKRESYKIVREFKQYAVELNKSQAVTFEPRYFVDGRFFKGSLSDDCYSNGKYCFKDPDGWGPANGRDMIDEILRQICIYKINSEKWWDYMDKVDQECIQPSNMKNCGNVIMESNSIDIIKVNNCVERSFIGQTNYLLDTEIEKSQGRAGWPGVTVNNMAYRGNLINKDILQIVCASMEKEIKICWEEFKNVEIVEDLDGGISKASLIVLIIVLLFCFFLFLIIVYRRWYQRELRNQMDQKVNPMVNQYIAFYETKKQVKNDI